MRRRSPTPAICGLAHRLVALEAQALGSFPAATLSASEKMRQHLSRLMGVTGFFTLLMRAFALARAEEPKVGVLMGINADGSIEGLGPPVSEAAAEAYPLLLAELLGLLVTFIGEQLTIQMVTDLWPDLPKEGESSEHDRTL